MRALVDEVAPQAVAGGTPRAPQRQQICVRYKWERPPLHTKHNILVLYRLTMPQNLNAAWTQGKIVSCS